MPDSRPPDHIRRARTTKRVQLLLAVASAAFVIYRLVLAFGPRGGLGR